MKDYNTEIIPLAGIPDLNFIYETIKLYNREADLDEIKNLFVKDNRFGFKLTSSSSRFFKAIHSVYLTGENTNQKQLFFSIFSTDDIPSALKRAVLYIETCNNNQLFMDITVDFMYEKYWKNNRIVSSNEVFEYLMRIKEGTLIDNWSENTIKTVAKKYIAFLRKLGYLEGYKRSSYMFNFPPATKKTIAYLVYYLKLTGRSDKKILESDLFNVFMLNKRERIDRVKEASLGGYYEFTLTGDLRPTIELNYGKEIVDELARS